MDGAGQEHNAQIGQKAPFFQKRQAEQQDGKNHRLADQVHRAVKQREGLVGKDAQPGHLGKTPHRDEKAPQGDGGKHPAQENIAVGEQRHHLQQQRKAQIEPVLAAQKDLTEGELLDGLEHEPVGKIIESQPEAEGG